jgi:hypothetical protein
MYIKGSIVSSDLTDDAPACGTIKDSCTTLWCDEELKEKLKSTLQTMRRDMVPEARSLSILSCFLPRHNSTNFEYFQLTLNTFN